MQSLFAASALQEATRIWILSTVGVGVKSKNEIVIFMSIFKVLCCPPCHLPLTDAFLQTSIPSLYTRVFDWTTWIDSALHRRFVNFAVSKTSLQKNTGFCICFGCVKVDKCQHISTHPHQTEKTHNHANWCGFLYIDLILLHPRPDIILLLRVYKSYWIITRYHKLMNTVHLWCEYLCSCNIVQKNLNYCSQDLTTIQMKILRGCLLSFLFLLQSIYIMICCCDASTLLQFFTGISKSPQEVQAKQCSNANFCMFPQLPKHCCLDLLGSLWTRIVVEPCIWNLPLLGLCVRQGSDGHVTSTKYHKVKSGQGFIKRNTPGAACICLLFDKGSLKRTFCQQAALRWTQLCFKIAMNGKVTAQSWENTAKATAWAKACKPHQTNATLLLGMQH